MLSLKFNLNRVHSPQSWLSRIIKRAETTSQEETIGWGLIEATLERRFKEITVPNQPAHATDSQTMRTSNFAILPFTYHVTAAPSRAVLEKCASNIKAGLHPILLVPREQENTARVLARDEGINGNLSIITIEDFVALNIIELAIEEKKELFSVLKEIVEIYNRRLAEVETDLSLQIEVH